MNNRLGLGKRCRSTVHLLVLLTLFSLPMLALSGCPENEVSYVLRFPSQDTFFISSNVTVLFYDGTENDPDEICRTLSVGLTPSGIEPIESVGPAEPCEFLDGKVTEGVPTGRVVIAVEVEDKAGAEILRGCKVADIYADTAEPVEVVLATLPDYPVDVEVTCSDVSQRCEDGETCIED